MTGFALAAPQHGDLQESISSVINTLKEERPRRIRDDIRSKIITKYDFMNRRDKKSSFNIPKEFVVTTTLNIPDESSQRVR